MLQNCQGIQNDLNHLNQSSRGTFNKISADFVVCFEVVECILAHSELLGFD